MISLLATTEFVATISCSIFAGAAIYINLVEHPARLECGTEFAATVFGPSYRRAAVMQAFLAILGCVSAIAAWFLGAGISWLVGGTLLGFVVPFTFLVIMPINKELLSYALDKNSPNTLGLLKRWGQLHAVRSGASFLALLVFLASIK